MGSVIWHLVRMARLWNATSVFCYIWPKDVHWNDADQ